MREERIAIGGHELVLSRPDDPESLIDERRFEEDEFLPYWADLWPSGIALARYVVGLDIAGSRVLELGCGLALPSFSAALAGADVLATDWAPEALTLVDANATANHLQVATELLDWHAAPPAGLAQFEVRSAKGALGAGRGTGEAGFNVVLAADVLYEERNAVPLLDLLTATLSPGGIALVADPGRRHAPAFFEKATRAGWSIEDAAAPELPSGSIATLRRAVSPASDKTLC
jgi:predicted nicotinamide N-methyase